MWNNFSLTNSPNSNSDLPQANAIVLPKSVASSTDPEGFILLVGRNGEGGQRKKHIHTYIYKEIAFYTIHFVTLVIG